MKKTLWASKGSVHTQQSGFKRLWKKNAIPYLFLAPWLIGFFVLTLYPMISSLYLSFTEFNMLESPKWVGVQNYVKMFAEDERYLKSLSVTFKFVFISVPLKLFFALMVALIMNRKMKGIEFYRTIYYIPTLLGGSVAIAAMWRKLFSSDGVINRIIYMVTGIEAPNWIANPSYALYTLIILAVWQFGSSMVIFLAGLKDIPKEYYEAAQVDGANKFQSFIHITLPTLSPVILFNLVMQIIMAFQSFTQAYVVSNGQGGPLDSTMFYTLYLYLKGFYYFEMGYASAMAWILLLIIAVFTAIIFATSKYWVSYGDGRD